MKPHLDISRSASLTAALGVLLILGPSACSSEVIQVVKKTVGRNAVLIVTKNGQPLVNVKVLIDEPQSVRARNWSLSPRAEGVTNSSGEVSLSGLPEGFYAVFVVLDGKRHWLGSLEVSSGITIADSRANYDVFPKFPSPCGTSPEPLQVRVRQLSGSVVDLTGAVITKVAIEVYKGIAPQGDPLIRLKTNENGRFHWEPGRGDYIVTFSSRGFMRQEVRVAIDPEGWHGMRVTLPIAGSDCGSERRGARLNITEEK